MRPRGSKILADFVENKARSLLVIASIAVGVFAVGMIAVGYTILPQGLHQVYANAMPANITIRTAPFQEDLAQRIARIEGVDLVEPRRELTIKMRPAGSKGSWQSMQLVVVNDFADQKLRLLTPNRGASLPGDRQLLLIENAIKLLEVDLGDQIEIQLADGTLRQLPIVGIVNDFSAGFELTFNPRVGYIQRETLAHLHAGHYFDMLIITVDGDANEIAHIEATAARVIKAIEDSGRPVYSSTLARASDHPYANYITALVGILSFLGVLVVILSSFLIVNTMNSLMGQQLRQIGVMKLVGARKRQIVGMYLTLMAIFGLVGLIFAIPAGAYVGYRITASIAPMMNGRLTTSTQVPLIPWVIAMQTAIALIVPLLAASAPVRQGAGVSVQQALSGTLIRQTGRDRPIDRLLSRMRGARGVLLLAIRNTFRRTDRLALTLFTLSLGGAVFIAVFNVQVSLQNQVDRITRYSNSDIYLQFERPYPSAEILAQLGTFPAITHVEAWQWAGAQLEIGEQLHPVTLMAPPDDTLIVDTVSQVGRWVSPLDQRGIVVNEAFLNDLPDLKPGDLLPLWINGEEVLWTVVGIFHYSGMDYKLAYTNYGSLAGVLHTTTQASNYRIVTVEHSLDYQRQVADQLDRHFRSQGFALDSAIPFQERIEEATGKMDMVIYVLLVQASLIGIVGSIGLSGTLSLNVLERTAEIGVLRAIGAHNRIVARLVLIEGLFIGLVSYLLALLLTVPISFLLSNLVTEAIFGAPSAFVLTSKGPGLWLGLIFLLTIAASLGPARNATRLTIREVLAYQ